jgi:transcriptional regulator with XRE-family HTH domain
MARTLDETKLYKTVGERIRTYRRAITPLVNQKDVADISDGELSRSSLANIEGGRQSISLHQLYRIADILNIDPRKLLPARQDVFEGTLESVQDDGKREWLSRVLDDESDIPKEE